MTTASLNHRPSIIIGHLLLSTRYSRADYIIIFINYDRPASVRTALYTRRVRNFLSSLLFYDKRLVTICLEHLWLIFEFVFEMWVSCFVIWMNLRKLRRIDRCLAMPSSVDVHCCDALCPSWTLASMYISRTGSNSSGNLSCSTIPIIYLWEPPSHGIRCIFLP